MTTDQPATSVATTNSPPPAPVPSGMPTPAEFTHVQQVAHVLAESDLVPTAYRRKPANIIVAALAGRPFGWDPTMSMRSFHIIEGSPSMKPEIMLALVRQAGHSVTGETSPTSATVTGTRTDTGDTMTVTFTIDDAKRAGLTRRNGPWQQYPQSMCWARALSQLCRMLFADVVLGAGYTPDELGARLADDDVIDVTEVDGIHVRHTGPLPVTEAAAKNQLVEHLAGDIDAAREAWKLRPTNLRTGGADHTPAHGDTPALLDADAVTRWIASHKPPSADLADVVDAELVEEHA